jgi:hypothetical protein
VPVDVINAVGFDSDDDNVLVVERVTGVDGDDHDSLLETANEVLCAAKDETSVEFMG